MLVLSILIAAVLLFVVLLVLRVLLRVLLVLMLMMALFIHVARLLSGWNACTRQAGLLARARQWENIVRVCVLYYGRPWCKIFSQESTEGSILKQLPEAFLAQMKRMLKEEYGAFLASYEQPAFRGVRRNPLKCSEEIWQKRLGLVVSPAPFSPFSFYYTAEAGIGSLPLHHAGGVYSQEPSAASAVTVLDPKPGDRVLDLCAAPGGKSTQIAALLGGEGLLLSNEPIRSRAQILLSNIERLGVRNAVVSSAYPENLCPHFPAWFDKVLVDAPCSGEGMFRRDETAVREWNPESPASCAQRQRLILDQAAGCVREGGVLVYSTCTFSLEENEETVQAFLQAHPDFEAEMPSVSFGRPAFGVPGLRIFPMDGGEGHFVARFRRTSGGQGSLRPFIPGREIDGVRLARAFLREELPGYVVGDLMQAGDRVLSLPAELPDLTGLPVLRAGVEVGTLRGKRLEPAHGLYMSARPEECARVLALSADDPRVAAFLHGEEIPCETKGYTAVSVDGMITGFGKASGGMLKNKYPKGLRTL